jgi:thymidylate synthase (FAD)
MQTQLIHSGDEKHILYIARVSSNQENTDPGLLSFLIRQNHWSPFEMIGACVEIVTTRDIGRQVLRHRSFSFQEFSGRYATYESLHMARDLRFKGGSNRQGSIPASTDQQRAFRDTMQRRMETIAAETMHLYQEMTQAGIAPECARAVLPEGLVPTRMYMNGTLRSWIHYLRERCKLDGNGLPYAQREHYEMAREIEVLLREAFPITFAALDGMQYIDRPLLGES